MIETHPGPEVGKQLKPCCSLRLASQLSWGYVMCLQSPFYFQFFSSRDFLSTEKCPRSVVKYPGGLLKL